MNSEYRPNPDELLEGIQKEQTKIQRGKLKVFFGMCPGVGKTFAMLRKAQEKRASGVKVVVGLVETHQRKETEELLSGLEIIPRRKVQYRGTTFEEFDLDRALELKPELILVDELAHTNAPGSKHPKRYQDIKDLLYAGINVYTTMNVQHVESRADLVYQISGVPVRETVPDAFLELADQIELIDLSPEDLLRRLKEGKVYLGERADRAAENFFKEEKLTALRELALRFTAEIVDDHLRDQMQSKRILGPWNTNERLMVAISHSPLTPRLIRSARRMAGTLEAPWVALYVDTGAALEPDDQERLARNMNLARELGAEVLTTRDHSVADALHRVAAERNVTQIVMGRPDRRFFKDLLRRGNILDRLVNETSEVDIHVIRQKRKPIYREFHLKLPRWGSLHELYVGTLLYVGAVVLLAYPFLTVVGYRAIGFGLLLAILPIAALAGLGPTLLGAVLTALSWDFFFIPPQFTLTVREAEDGMMILAYLAVASVAGFLASRIKRQEQDLLQRERRAGILYAFGRELAEAKTPSEMAVAAARSIEAVLPSSVVVFGVDRKKKPEKRLSRRPLHDTPATLSEKDFAVAVWTFDNQRKAGWKTDTLSSSPALCLPLRSRSGMIGVLALLPKENRALSLDQENLLESLCGHLAIALEREAFEEDSRKAEIYEKSEKLHQELLNTVSHELRTPLTSILGGATALRDPETQRDSATRDRLIDDVILSSERLNHTIENLMDMSRISSGVLKLNEHVFDLNDFIRATLRRLNRTSTHRLAIDLGEEDFFVQGDEKILEHVLFNLVGNASRYAPAGTTITLRSRVVTKPNGERLVALSILDEGPGIPESELPKIFERFHRVPGSPPGGVGLGLSIAKAILEAHGGAIVAKNRDDRRGAEFTFTLPLREIPAEILR